MATKAEYVKKIKDAIDEMVKDPKIDDDMRANILDEVMNHVEEHQESLGDDGDEDDEEDDDDDDDEEEEEDPE